MSLFSAVHMAIRRARRELRSYDPLADEDVSIIIELSPRAWMHFQSSRDIHWAQVGGGAIDEMKLDGATVRVKEKRHAR